MKILLGIVKVIMANTDNSNFVHRIIDTTFLSVYNDKAMGSEEKTVLLHNNSESENSSKETKDLLQCKQGNIAGRPKPNNIPKLIIIVFSAF